MICSLQAASDLTLNAKLMPRLCHFCAVFDIAIANVHGISQRHAWQ